MSNTNKFSFCVKVKDGVLQHPILSYIHSLALWQDFERKVQRESTNKAKDLGGTWSCVYVHYHWYPHQHIVNTLWCIL